MSDFVADPAWSDPFPLHPDTIETRLDNGLRLIVRRNTAPGRQAHLRLVVPAGSIDETPPFLGSAHYLEHMMFNGTERFPGNELVPVLESFGAAFGPDVNASTSRDETVYVLTVPVPAPGALELALEVLAEWAARATVAPDAVEAERGVIREEYRQGRETVSGRLGEVVREVLLADSVYLGREPIGTLESIEAMRAPELRDFYERWYRPDLMTVIAVGDFDTDTVVGLIDAAFGPLEAPDVPVPGPTIDSATGGLVEPVFDVFADPELTRTEVSVRWRTDNVDPLTPADLRSELARELTVALLDRRLFEAVERGRSRAISAGAEERLVTNDLTTLVVRGRSAPDEVLGVLTELLTVSEQARQYEFDERDFSQGVAELRTRFEQARAQAGRRQDSAIARGYTRYVLGEGIEGDPDTVLALALDVLDSLDPVDVRVVMDELLSTPPYVLVATPAASEAEVPTPEAIADAYDEIVGWVVAPPPPSPEGVEVLLERPDPAGIVSDEFDAALSTRVVTYDNGLRLAVRPTRIVDNRIEFQGWSRGGFFVEEAVTAPLLGRTSAFVVGSGFVSLDPVDVDRFIGDQVIELHADVDRAVELVTGEAATADLETLLQLVHLQMTEPTITDVAVRRFVDAWRPIAVNPEILPELAGHIALWRMRYGDSPYFRRIPTVEDLDRLDPAAQLAAWQQRFADAGDFVFVFVGDLDPDEVVELGARYLGTLPSGRGAPETSIDRDPGLPEANLVETVAAGVGQRAELRINWESPYPFTLEAAVAARALELIVNARLRDVIREELGATYSPDATVSVLSEPKSWVDTIIEIETDPERIVEVSEAVHAELAAIRAGDLDPGYLERAVDQLVERHRFVTNPEWIDRITFHLANPGRSSSEFRRRTPVAQELTVDDIAAAARIVFPATRSVEVRLVPAP